jgi:hypothetical protein
MPITIRGEKDFYIGVIYLTLGLAGFILARGYAFGTPGRMGAGFFPTIISGLLVVFGLVAAIRGLIVPSPALGKVDWKGIALIIASVCAFGLLLESAGLPIAIIVSGLLAAVASDRFKLDWRAAAGLVALAAFCSLVFVLGLGVPMPLIGDGLAAFGF